MVAWRLTGASSSGSITRLSLKRANRHQPDKRKFMFLNNYLIFASGQVATHRIDLHARQETPPCARHSVPAFKNSIHSPGVIYETHH
jgi:hypothetical protein